MSPIPREALFLAGKVFLELPEAAGRGENQRAAGFLRGCARCGRGHGTPDPRYPALSGPFSNRCVDRSCHSPLPAQVTSRLGENEAMTFGTATTALHGCSRVRSPARTSATCTARTVRPRRCMRPSRCSRQPRSPPTTKPAPVAAMSSIFWSAMCADTSGYFTQNNPPKPQHSSPLASSRRSRPRTRASKARGCSRMPSWRKPEQAS